MPQQNQPAIYNMKHQHAFILVGENQLFGVHMTQYHCELHKYQIILRISIPQSAQREFLRFRKLFPNDTFVLCNAKASEEKKVDKKAIYEFSIPELASGRVKKFKGNIFQGIGPIPENPGPHFFPWPTTKFRPIIGNIDVTVEHLVTFRPFDHLHTLPEFATYLLFGNFAKDKPGAPTEVHMTNLQTARMVTNGFEPQQFGIDYDHVMSIKVDQVQIENWIQDSMLEAGIPITIPRIRLLDAETGKPTIPEQNPLPEGEVFDVMYRGIGPACQLTAGPTYSFCTAVCNSEALLKSPDKSPHIDGYLDDLPKIKPVLGITPMPKIYYVFD